jgi:vitamin B12 transporter
LHAFEEGVKRHFCMRARPSSSAPSIRIWFSSSSKNDNLVSGRVSFLLGTALALGVLGLFVPPSAGAQAFLDAGSTLDAGPAPSANDAVDAARTEPNEEVIDVTVREPTVAETMQQSAASVTVLELSAARRQSADFGELMARTQGVGVRRSGGLGSTERISLNGLEGDRIRLFVDALPLTASPYGNGISNVPVNLVERVEIYRGVVPIRFGADALGGAINVVTKAPTRGTGGSASLQLGSFGLTRGTAEVHHYSPKTGLLARANAYGDYAKNDYPIRVSVPNSLGQQSRIEAYRRHDAYRTYGAGLDVGYLRRKWAERLVLKAFASGYEKQLQSDLLQLSPYGKVRYGGENYGTNLQYVQPLTDKLKLDATASYTFANVNFVDTSKFVYDWFGQQIRAVPSGGEIDPLGRPYDLVTHTHNVFGRLNLSYDLAPGHVLYLTVAPNFTKRNSRDDSRAPTDFDAAEAHRELTNFVTGLEYALQAWDERIDNSLFVKGYLFRASASEPLNSGLTLNRDQRRRRLGFGDGVRVHITNWFYGKLSYELATRLPNGDELFGDGRQITSNLLLKPEWSHNTNLTLALHDLSSPVGTFQLQVNGFDRHAHDLISPPQVGAASNGAFAQYQNIGLARSTGFELVGGWEAPKNYLALNGNVTWQDFRNTSERGPTATFKDDRIPNVPYFFANVSARATLADLMSPRDELSLTYYMRWVHQFYRGWESAGSGLYANAKAQVDTQVSHALSLTYLVHAGKQTYSVALDALNLTNRALFDEYGAQRPGRGYYFKLTAEL